MREMSEGQRRVLHIAASAGGVAAEVSVLLRRQGTVETCADLYRGLARMLTDSSPFDAVVLCLDWFDGEALEFVRRAAECGQTVLVYQSADGGVDAHEAMRAGARGVFDPRRDDLAAMWSGVDDEYGAGVDCAAIGDDDTALECGRGVRVPWRDDPERPVRKGPGGNGEENVETSKRRNVETGGEGPQRTQMGTEGERRNGEVGSGGGALLTEAEIEMLLGEGN
ncbi:MAG: hypothetical protein HOP29_11115 [Phycisphaerales bacterium]|nr:hypothetical protein [Phycisphaerales bacterium]